MRLLITGASGFIGRACLRVISADIDVHATSSRPQLQSASGTPWHQVNLLDPAASRLLFEAVRPTHWLHLAWHVPPAEFWTSPLNHRWVTASLDMFDSFVATGGRRLVAAGTCAEYDWTTGFCGERQTPLRPATIYGECKHALAQQLASRAAAAGIELAWGRVFHVYGPHERRERFVPAIVRGALSGTPVVCRTPHARRDLLFVDDLARAFVALVESAVCGALNLASGTAVRLGDVAQIIARHAGGTVAPLDAASESADDVIADNKRLRAEVGWQPTYTLDSGLGAAVDWWRSEIKSEQTA